MCEIELAESEGWQPKSITPTCIHVWIRSAVGQDIMNGWNKPMVEYLGSVRMAYNDRSLDSSRSAGKLLITEEVRMLPNGLNKDKT